MLRRCSTSLLVSLTVKKQHSSILIAEDDADVRGLISVIIENAGYNVFTAADGKEAVEQANEIFAEPYLYGFDDAHYRWFQSH